MKYGNFYKWAIIILVLLIFLAVLRFNRTHMDNRNKGTAPESTEYIPVPKSEADADKNPENEQQTEISYPDMKEVVPETELCPEGFTISVDDIEINCYFTNTAATIDIDGILPLYAQGILPKTAQKWINDKGYSAEEFRCIDGSIESDQETVSFKAQYNDLIVLFTYIKNERRWQLQQR